MWVVDSLLSEMLNCHLCVCLRDADEEESQTDRNNVERGFVLFCFMSLTGRN